jgi:hypothetical protein
MALAITDLAAHKPRSRAFGAMCGQISLLEFPRRFTILNSHFMYARTRGDGPESSVERQNAAQVWDSIIDPKPTCYF